VLALQTIVSRCIRADSPVVVSCCKVQSGTTSNVIPDTYEIWGTIRDFSESDFKIVKQKMIQIGNYKICNN